MWLHAPLHGRFALIRLALSDIDNTLVPFGQPYASDRVFEAMRNARAAGVQFGPATGRDEQELMRFFKGDRSCFATGILSNGKKVLVDGELVWVRYVENLALQRLAEAFRPLPGCFVIAYPAKTSLDNPAYVIGANTNEMAVFEQRFKFNGIIVNEVPDMDLIAATIACTESAFTLDDVRRISRSVSPEFDVVSPVPNWFDVIPAGVSKASAFDILLGKLGLTPEEAVFFGDAENDLQIMARTPNSVAVANATPAAAEAARFHIGPVTADGVADALDELATAAREGRTAAFLQG